MTRVTRHEVRDKTAEIAALKAEREAFYCALEQRVLELRAALEAARRALEGTK
jgi:hypothetical protein